MLTALLADFPVPILAGPLVVAAVLHFSLLRDLAGRGDRTPALNVGAAG